MPAFATVVVAESPVPLGIEDHPSVVAYSRSPLPARFGAGPTHVPAPQNPPVTQAVPSVQLVKQAFDWQRKPLQLTGAFATHRPCPSQDDPLISEAVPEQVVELPHLLPAA
jgi:hypothetical protein